MQPLNSRHVGRAVLYMLFKNGLSLLGYIVYNEGRNQTNLHLVPAKVAELK
jgi:hypothetical protein